MKTGLFYKFLTYCGVGLASFFAPITWAIYSALLMVLIDTITGVMKAGKKDVKQVKSKRMGDVLAKVIFYLSAISISQVCQLYVDTSVPFVKLALVAVIIIEVKSIDENFRDTFGFSFIDKLLEAAKLLKRKEEKK